MSETNEVIEWKFPTHIRKLVTQRLGWMALGTIALLTAGNLFMLNSRTAVKFQIVSFLTLGLLLIFIYIMSRQIERTEKATYRADDLGFHGEPVFDFKWSELRSISTVSWLFPETRLLILKARSPMKTRTMITGPFSVELLHLLEFSRRKIAEAAPSA